MPVPDWKELTIDPVVLEGSDPHHSIADLLHSVVVEQLDLTDTEMLGAFSFEIKIYYTLEDT
jgi:hypothetical protein